MTDDRKRAHDRPEVRTLDDVLTPPIPPETDAPEANATMRRAWSEPGGEAQAYRSATVGAGGKSDDHGELTAEETPAATRHLGDASQDGNDAEEAGNG